jgi:hypothetical protein
MIRFANKFSNANLRQKAAKMRRCHFRASRRLPEPAMFPKKDQETQPLFNP